MKGLAFLLALVLCFSVMPMAASAADLESLETPSSAYTIPLQGYITDPDGTIVEIVNGNVGGITPFYAPVARTFTLNPGQKFTSYQYAGSEFDWIGGEITTFSRGSSVNLKVQRATSIGGTRTNAVNTILRANGTRGVSLSRTQYGNIIYTNTTSSTISFYGFVIVNDR